MTQEWLITTENSDGELTRYYKYAENSYGCECIGSTVARYAFKSKQELVADVCYNARRCHRVKEIPQQYGEFWRGLFARCQILNWADTIPENGQLESKSREK